MMTMDFIRRPVLEGLSLGYQAQITEDIDPPIDGVDDLEFFGKGLVQGQMIGRMLSECIPRFLFL